VTLGGLRTVQTLKKAGKKIIVHWIGTDSYNATTNIKSKFIAKRYKGLADIHLANPRLVDELDSIGIKPIPLPLPVFRIFEPKPLPHETRVLVYLPDSRKDFFRKQVIDKVIESFPKLNFVILPYSASDYLNKSNVTSIPWADDMESIFSDTSIFIRLPMHDGLGHSVIEALSMGRYVIYSHEFPHCKQAVSIEQVNESLCTLITKSSPNNEGSSYVRSEYNKDKIREQLTKIYNTL